MALLSTITRALRYGAAWAALALWLAAAAPLQAEGPSADEPALKAALLFNVARFTEWGETQRAAHLCLIGEEPFGEVIDQVARLTAQRWGDDEPYTVRRIRGPEQATACRIVFIATSESSRPARLQALLDHPALAGALIVGDDPHFTERGGTLGLVRQGARLRFSVNLDSLCHHRLSIRAQALQLAIIVGSGECR